MYLKMEKIGISDLTSSEGKLSDFNTICKIIANKRSLTKEKIFLELKGMTRSSAYKSFERKLIIMQKLGLIEQIRQVYILASAGKVLNKLLQRSPDRMEPITKSFYFIAFFTSTLSDQLAALLATINRQQGRTRKEIVMDYFATKIALDLWGETARKNVQSLRETNIMPSMLNNKFSCMQRWLEHLQLIESKRNRLYSLVPREVVTSLMQQLRMNNIYNYAAMIYFTKAKKFDYTEDYQTLIDILKEAHKSFCVRETGLSDIQAVAKYVCLKLLQKQCVLEERNFFELTKRLVTDRIIRSVMVGREGQPKHLAL